MTTSIRVTRRGRLGVIELDRQEALNALTHEMVLGISAALDQWRDDDDVATIAITGAGDRGLCAGGDVVSVRRDVLEHGGVHAAEFWRDEYAMNAAIASYEKPIVAVQHGIVLGGGVGVSSHASHRVVTETTRIGFPEVTIGFVPDVGASWLLSRAPGELGTRMALTGEHVRAADAIVVGLSDAFVPGDRTPKLLELLETVDADAAIAQVAAAPPSGELEASRALVDAAFEGDDLAAILQRLRDAGDDGRAIADVIASRSPFAVSVALESLRRASRLETLEDALVQEYRVTMHMARAHDFAEGIRAQLVDKDRSPAWQPAALADVTRAMVDACFEPALEPDLRLERHAGAARADTETTETEEQHD